MKKVFFLILIVLFAVLIFLFFNEKNKDKINFNVIDTNSTVEIPKKEYKELLITAVGDCTLGSDPNFSYTNSFIEYYDKNGPEYFFSEVKDIFENDDITVANLETTFTDSNNKVAKAYNFKAPGYYSEILKKGSVEIVNIANNHILDFSNEGYIDTMDNLNKNNIPFFGEDNYYIYEIKGLKVGFIGYYSNFNKNIYNDLDKGLQYLKDNSVDLIIVSFHWGIEGNLYNNDVQEKLGKYVIDNGGDLVIGHHPHVVQGIEEYKGKYILYSLGNFSFGGNKNPKDKDTYIFQEKFIFENNNIVNTTINIIPARVSSVSSTNNYQPVILDGSEKERILNKILKYSKNIDYEQ